MPSGRWIPENRATRIPRTHICLDTESWQTVGDGQTLHTFRCAVTSIDRMDHKAGQWLPAELVTHMTAEGVWEYVSRSAKPKQRTVLVAHNLGFDLRVAEAFTHLPRLGWVLDHLSLAPGSTWLTWKRQGATLSMVDSMTWLPTSLANIGDTIGRVKPALPADSGRNELWLERCRQDVAILRDAWLRIVNFLRDEDCGNWRPTGAGQSWSFWRHRMITHPVFAHDDQEIRAIERRAGWAGRAEAWRFGRQTRGPFVEWDFSCCYARIAQRCEVPTELIGEMHAPTLERVQKTALSRSVLIECAVTVSEPVVPTSYHGRIVWPVGTFTTTLWDTEVALALSAGAELTIHRAWVYRRAPALKQWADWVLERIYAPPGAVDPVVRAVCKHWARALIGRFGTRFGVWEPFGDALCDGAGLLGWSDRRDGASGELLSVGGRSWLATEMVDHPLSAPQVMSWISAQARVDLWGAMNAAGLENVVYVDTDSLIVDRVGDARLSAVGIVGLRRKAKWQSLTVLGTRKLVQDRKLKAAGVARGARRLGSSSWSAESWDSLQASLKSGEPGAVRVVSRKVTFQAVDGRRVRTPGGGSEPFCLMLTDGGDREGSTVNLMEANMAEQEKRYVPTSGADAAQLDPNHPDHDPNTVVVTDDEYAAMQRGEDPPKSAGSSKAGSHK